MWQKTWSIFLKRCQSFEMCCANSVLLSTGWCQVSVQLLEEAQVIWVRFGFGPCCSASAGSVRRISACCVESQLKFIHLPTPTCFFFALFLSHLLYLPVEEFIHAEVEITELFQDLSMKCWPVLLFAKQHVVSLHISNAARLAELAASSQLLGACK